MPRENTGSPTGTNAGAVARHAVDDDGRHALVLRHHGDVVADHGRLREAIRRHHDDIAGLGQHERRQDRQIVVGAGLAGERRAHELRAFGVHRLDAMIQRRAPLQGIDDVAGLGALQLGDEVAARAGELAAHGQKRRVLEHGVSLRGCSMSDGRHGEENAAAPQPDLAATSGVVVDRQLDEVIVERPRDQRFEPAAHQQVRLQALAPVLDGEAQRVLRPGGDDVVDIGAEDQALRAPAAP